MKIVRATEQLVVANTNVMVYGSPGTGKTSCAFTASKPLCLDFDHGSHRSGYRGDTVIIDSWSEVSGLGAQDLVEYDTVILDTVGRALDYLIMEIGSRDRRLVRESGEPTLQGYGELKSTFARWVKGILTLGKDVIFLAHDKEARNGDDLYIRPDITGGTYHEIFKLCDAVGRLHKRGDDKTVLDFSPRGECLGKNPAGLQPLVVPSFDDEPNWFAGQVTAIKKGMGCIAKTQFKAVEELEEFKAECGFVESADDANTLLGLDKYFKGNRALVAQRKKLLQVRVTELGITYDKKQKAFV
jgi:phage nucleotide-binding protein